VIALAVITGVAPQAWSEAGHRAIATAMELIEDRNRRQAEALGQYTAPEVTEADGRRVQFSG